MGDVLGRLDDHRVSAEQRGKHFPGRDREWKVEGRNQADDADGPAIAHRPFGAKLRGDHMAEEPATFGRGVVSSVDSLLYIAPGFSQNLAHFASHGIRDGLLSLDQEIADPPQHVTPDRRRGPAPERKAPLAERTGPRPRGRGESESGKRPIRSSGRGRVAILEVRSIGGLRPLSRDEIAERLGLGRPADPGLTYV